MDITQISNHNGDINREVRLIYVIDRGNGMPIYFRYAAGNIIDVSTLITTINELEQYGVSVSHAILNAGYYSEKNAAELFESGIPFMTGLAPNKTVFKDTAAGNLDDFMSQKHAYRYGERLVQPCINNGELNCQRYPCVCPFERMGSKVMLFDKAPDALLQFFY